MDSPLFSQASVLYTVEVGWPPVPLLLPYLFQPIEHRDEKAHVRQPLVVQVSDPLHQFWGWWYFRKTEKNKVGVTGRRRRSMG